MLSIDHFMGIYFKWKNASLDTIASNMYNGAADFAAEDPSFRHNSVSTPIATALACISHLKDLRARDLETCTPERLEINSSFPVFSPSAAILGKNVKS